MNKSSASTKSDTVKRGPERSFISSISRSKKIILPLRMKEVLTRKDARLFREFPKYIHRQNPDYIKPLDRDIEAIFNEKKNRCFKQDQCSRWLLYNRHGFIIGRIAVFINADYAQEQPTGGVGFFDCIDSTSAAHFMFDHCKNWLLERGIKAMDGPINLGERLNWWGLLVEGFHAPLYGMNYNPPYYQHLFESYGFQVYFYQHCYSIPLNTRLPEKFYRIKDIVSKDSRLKAIPFSKKHSAQFARDFTSIYNRSWECHGEGKKLNDGEAFKLFERMKTVIDERAIWFVYHSNEPVACWLNLPDLNNYFRSVNGKLGPLGILKLLISKLFHPSRKLVGLLFGVVPEFQNKGIDAFMIVSALEEINSNTGYNDYEMQWIGDFNPRMINTAQNMGAACTRKLATYRYLFNRQQSFTKHPVITV